MRPIVRYALLVMVGASLAATTVPPAEAQSVGYATGLPGRDPADDDEIGWGPAYRPETTFAQPGTPPTPGQIAGEAYRARTGHGVYDDVQGWPAPRARVSGERPFPKGQYVGRRASESRAARQRRLARATPSSRRRVVVRRFDER